MRAKQQYSLRCQASQSVNSVRLATMKLKLLSVFTSSVDLGHVLIWSRLAGGWDGRISSLIACGTHSSQFYLRQVKMKVLHIFFTTLFWKTHQSYIICFSQMASGLHRVSRPASCFVKTTATF